MTRLQYWLKLSLLSLCGWGLWPVHADSPKTDSPKKDASQTVAPNGEAAAVDFSKGALHGKVVDITNGQPIADATVAVQDKNGKVLAWTKTDAGGQYTIAAETLKVLQLQPSKRGGLLSGLAHGIGKVATAPVKIAAGAAKAATGTVKQIDPINTAKSTVIAAATGSPAPLVAQVTGSVANNAKTKLQDADKAAKETAARTMLGERQATPKDKRDAPVPGEVRIAVSAANHKDLKGKAGAYWLEPSTNVENKPMGTQAWLETVKLAPEGSDKKSEVENMALLLAEPHLDPPLAPLGTTVKINVKLQVPAGVTPKVRVFAREARQHKVIELQPQANNIFSGELPLAASMPVGETTITLAALRQEPVEINLKESKDDPLLDFAGRLDDLDPTKPYEYDPRIMASENRLDVALTVLDPKQGTPPAPAPAATSPAPGTVAAPANPPATPNPPQATPGTAPAPPNPAQPAATPAQPQPTQPQPATPTSPAPAPPAPAK